MKKIVHIMLTGPVTDGWTYQDNIITKYHRKRGYDVTIITSEWIYDNNGELKKDNRHEYINENDVKVIRLPIVGKDIFNRKFKRYKSLLTTLKSERPDILFVHGVAFRDIKTIVKYILTNLKCTVYVDNHADFSNSGRNWLAKNVLHKTIWKHYAQMIEPYVKKFYGVLPARVDWLVDMYNLPKEKCELLVMGADDEKVEEAQTNGWRNIIREKYNINNDDFLIMTGGKIDIAKTQTLLLMEAVRRINDKHVKLIVFGSVVKGLQKNVRALTDGEKIQYIGWVEADKSYSYWSAADLVVFPGRHSVFWEQVAGMGIPMICKYWEGTTHVDCGGNVKFIKTDDIDEIKDLIKHCIYNKEEFEAMKSAAKDGAHTFSYKNIAARAIDINEE